MIQRRARKAGLLTAVRCHSLSGMGITNYLGIGGTFEA
jgi:hypothetical protein